MSTTEDAPSSFGNYITDPALRPALVVDLGCGDSRDATKFVRNGALVLGLDRSTVAIKSAQERRLSQEAAVFIQCDLEERGALPSALDIQAINRSPRHFYPRQLLDSITEVGQEILLADVADLIQPGDGVAFEFRGIHDKTLTGHERWSCGRRTVDPQTVREWISSAGLTILADEASEQWERRNSKGIHLNRIIAEKSV